LKYASGLDSLWGTGCVYYSMYILAKKPPLREHPIPDPSLLAVRYSHWHY